MAPTSTDISPSRLSCCATEKPNSDAELPRHTSGYLSSRLKPQHSCVIIIISKTAASFFIAFAFTS
ncbi:MAG: hypothetical protein AAFP26_07375, partial [Planctomycetota bacterium]